VASVDLRRITSAGAKTREALPNSTQGHFFDVEGLKNE